MLKARPLTPDFEREIESAYEETIALLKTLCAIPAPSHHEERRSRSSLNNGLNRVDFLLKLMMQKCAVRLRP